MSAWPSMDSAPRDGTRILAETIAGTIVICHWPEGASVADEGWYTDNGRPVSVTRWQHLPDLSKATDQTPLPYDLKDDHRPDRLSRSEKRGYAATQMMAAMMDGFGSTANTEDMRQAFAEEAVNRADALLEALGMEEPAAAALAIIIGNARLVPDPAMDGATDCYAVPLDDIDAARKLVAG